MRLQIRVGDIPFFLRTHALGNPICFLHGWFTCLRWRRLRRQLDVERRNFFVAAENVVLIVVFVVAAKYVVALVFVVVVFVSA